MDNLSDFQQSMVDSMNNGQSFDSWYNDNFGVNPNNKLQSLFDRWGGSIDSAQSQWKELYNRWSLENQQKYEYELTRALRSTEYQDAVQSMRDAGLNPYALMSGNFATGNSYSTSTNQLSYDSGSISKNSKAGIYAFMYMLGRVLAAML